MHALKVELPTSALPLPADFPYVHAFACAVREAVEILQRHGLAGDMERGAHALRNEFANSGINALHQIFATYARAYLNPDIGEEASARAAQRAQGCLSRIRERGNFLDNLSQVAKSGFTAYPGECVRSVFHRIVDNIAIPVDAPEIARVLSDVRDLVNMVNQEIDCFFEQHPSPAGISAPSLH